MLRRLPILGSVQPLSREEIIEHPDEIGFWPLEDCPDAFMSEAIDDLLGLHRVKCALQIDADWTLFVFKQINSTNFHIDAPQTNPPEGLVRPRILVSHGGNGTEFVVRFKERPRPKSYSPFSMLENPDCIAETISCPPGCVVTWDTYREVHRGVPYPKDTARLIIGLAARTPIVKQDWEAVLS